MNGIAWLAGLLAVTSLLAAGVLIAAAVRGRDERSACLAHATMSLGMAGMFAPGFDPVPEAAWVVAFAGLGAWYAARYLRRGPGSGAAALHLVISCAAMLLMYMTMGHGDGAPESVAAGSGHGGHGSGTVSDGGSLLLIAATLGLAAYFGWHAFLTSRGTGPTGDRRSSVQLAHVTMSVLMAAMLLGVP